MIFSKFESFACTFQGTIFDILLTILKSFAQFWPSVCLGSGEVSCTEHDITTNAIIEAMEALLHRDAESSCLYWPGIIISSSESEFVCVHNTLGINERWCTCCWKLLNGWTVMQYPVWWICDLCRATHGKGPINRFSQKCHQLLNYQNKLLWHLLLSYIEGVKTIKCV